MSNNDANKGMIILETFVRYVFLVGEFQDYLEVEDKGKFLNLLAAACYNVVDCRADDGEGTGEQMWSGHGENDEDNEIDGKNTENVSWGLGGTDTWVDTDTGVSRIKEEQADEITSLRKELERGGA
jgi:hypothetical protein